jgi:glycosyltransferase involved in cell wall biosynthesis
MHQCRILLNTSPTEGMPNTALQALAAGLYVVGPANEGLVELARRYPGHVTLVDIAKPVEVADVLRVLHQTPLPGPAPVPRSADVAKMWIHLFREGVQP